MVSGMASSHRGFADTVQDLLSAKLVTVPTCSGVDGFARATSAGTSTPRRTRLWPRLAGGCAASSSSGSGGGSGPAGCLRVAAVVGAAAATFGGHDAGVAARAGEGKRRARRRRPADLQTPPGTRHSRDGELFPERYPGRSPRAPPPSPFLSRTDDELTVYPAAAIRRWFEHNRPRRPAGVARRCRTSSGTKLGHPNISQAGDGPGEAGPEARCGQRRRRTSPAPSPGHGARRGWRRGCVLTRSAVEPSVEAAERLRVRSISSTVTLVSAVGRRASSSSATRALRSAARARACPRSTGMPWSLSPGTCGGYVEGGSPAAAARRLIIGLAAGRSPGPSAAAPPGPSSGRAPPSAPQARPPRRRRRGPRPRGGGPARRAASSPTPRSPARSCRA